MNHTSEPWKVELDSTPFYSSIGGAYFVRGPDNEYIARLTDETEPREANSKRIIACVNACIGMDNPKAEIERLKQLASL